MKKPRMIKGIALGMAASLMASAAPAQAPELRVLEGLQLGVWDLRVPGSERAPKKICIRDPKELIQIQHGGPLCVRKILQNDDGELYVYYKCGGKGHGYTKIRRENGGLIHISSQGIANNAPFNTAYEGRYAGQCN